MLEKCSLGADHDLSANMVPFSAWLGTAGDPHLKLGPAVSRQGCSGCYCPCLYVCLDIFSWSLWGEFASRNTDSYSPEESHTLRSVAWLSGVFTHFLCLKQTETSFLEPKALNPMPQIYIFMLLQEWEVINSIALTPANYCPHGVTPHQFLLGSWTMNLQWCKMTGSVPT